MITALGLGSQGRIAPTALSIGSQGRLPGEGGEGSGLDSSAPFSAGGTVGVFEDADARVARIVEAAFQRHAEALEQETFTRVEHLRQPASSEELTLEALARELPTTFIEADTLRELNPPDLNLLIQQVLARGNEAIRADFKKTLLLLMMYE